MKKQALISECGNYRYALFRIWDESLPRAMFIMLNPSTADAEKDDPTIRRCIDFAKSWGYGGLYVGNLFAYRSTNPKELLNKDVNIIGADNICHLKQMSDKCDIVVCAWGNSHIVKLLSDYRPLADIRTPLRYISLSSDGTPKHPLYLKKDLKPQRFTDIKSFSHLLFKK